PPVHGAAVVRLARAGRPAVDRGSRGSLRQQDPRLPTGDAAPAAPGSGGVALALPGVVAGTLLTFLPAAGDFINAQLLGGPNNHMIGNVIQSKFLELSDYPSAAAMSFILMGAILAFVAVYAFIVATEQLTGTAL